MAAGTNQGDPGRAVNIQPIAAIPFPMMPIAASSDHAESLIVSLGRVERWHSPIRDAFTMSMHVENGRARLVGRRQLVTWEVVTTFRIESLAKRPNDESSETPAITPGSICDESLDSVDEN